ncbi:sialic acid synthase SpsE [Crossiella equi]|uniref:Sialic acid synthase SpsE n=1 Tax=Crossiella equi TaxID=130796 RepID=A0ABS5ACD3_9PSEU|nr:hypothetical protein [Crossiella equi]MBP2474006.1 sialic acid synthase SpsE [Crossiella equi]
MRNLPVNLSGFRLMVTEAPTPKTRLDDNGQTLLATNRDGSQQFVVSLFAKQRVAAGERAFKGEEIKVTLTCDPGESFDEGDYVELVNGTVSFWSNERGAGLSFRADGLKPYVNPARAATAA